MTKLDINKLIDLTKIGVKTGVNKLTTLDKFFKKYDGELLYNNEEGETSVTISKEAGKFKKIVVIAKQTAYNDTTYHTVEIYNPNNKSFTIQSINPSGTNKGYYFMISAYKIMDKNINRIDNISYKMEIENSGHWYIIDSLVITKVIGYK